MKATFKAEAPGAIDFTLTLTMPLVDWVRLRTQLCKATIAEQPSRIMVEAIRDLERRATQTFEAEDLKPKEDR